MNQFGEPQADERGVLGVEEAEPVERRDERRRGSGGWGRTIARGETRFWRRDMLGKDKAERDEGTCCDFLALFLNSACQRSLPKKFKLRC